MRKRLENKYRMRKKGDDVVIEELKQDLSAVSHKTKRYTEQIEWYNQNRILSTTRDSFIKTYKGMDIAPRRRH